MCSPNDFPPYDDPSTYTAPEPVRPRTYVLSGDPLPSARVVVEEPRASIALAILGEMLNGAEYALERVVIHEGRGLAYELAVARVDTLREARDRITKAGG